MDAETGELYDSIGTTYTVTRRTEPRIAAQLWAALGDAETVLNVGAGTGSYEPSDRLVVAVEPSATMARGASRRWAAVRRWTAGEPAVPRSVVRRGDGVLHDPPPAGPQGWPARDVRRVAVLVWWYSPSTPATRPDSGSTRDYLPEVTDLRTCQILASLPDLARSIGARTEPVPIPWDCTDGFYEAYWRRPEAYLDENVRRGISLSAAVGPQVEARAVDRLRRDIASGRWIERNAISSTLMPRNSALAWSSPDPQLAAMPAARAPELPTATAGMSTSRQHARQSPGPGAGDRGYVVDHGVC